MIEIQSVRAKNLLANLVHQKPEKTTTMRKYPGHPELWVDVEWSELTVKKLSFFGNLADFEKIILESTASLMAGKRIDSFSSLTLRECEAYLRDKNSVLSIQGMTEKEEKDFKSLFVWISHWPRPVVGKNYVFPSEKGMFRGLSLVDKIREVKSFLQSPEILTLYANFTRPEVVDVDQLTVYIEAPYHSAEEKALFEELHLLGVAAFQEEELNFIPES